MTGETLDKGQQSDLNKQSEPKPNEGAGAGAGARAPEIDMDALALKLAPNLIAGVSQLIAAERSAVAHADSSIALTIEHMQNEAKAQQLKAKLHNVADAGKKNTLAVKQQVSMLCDILVEQYRVKAAMQAAVAKGAVGCDAAMAAVERAIRVVNLQFGHKHVAATTGYNVADPYYEDVLPIARDPPAEGTFAKQDLTVPEPKTLKRVMDLYKDKSEEKSRPITPAPYPRQQQPNYEPRYDPRRFQQPGPRPFGGYQGQDRRQEYDRRDGQGPPGPKRQRY